MMKKRWSISAWSKSFATSWLLLSACTPAQDSLTPIPSLQNTSVCDSDELQQLLSAHPELRTLLSRRDQSMSLTSQSLEAMAPSDAPATPTRPMLDSFDIYCQELLTALKTADTEQNQLALYRHTYEQFVTSQSVVAQRVAAAALSPDRAAELSADQLKQLNASLAPNLLSLGQGHLAEGPQGPVGALHACATEARGGSLTDGSAACSHRSGGIYDKNTFFLTKDYLTCIKQQANRGTCVSFAITSLLETQKSWLGAAWVNLSEQDLYRHARWTTMGMSADYGDGLDIGATLTNMNTYNMAYEDEWPYNPSYFRRDTGASYTNSCDGYSGTPCSDSNHQAARVCTGGTPPSCTYVDSVSKSSGIGRVGGYLTLPAMSDTDVHNLRYYTGGGLVLRILVTDQFYTPASDGTVSYVSGAPTRGSHAVHLVGYVDNTDLPAGIAAGAGGGYFIIKNSWGCSWGDGGMGYLPYNYVRDNGGLAYELGSFFIY